MNVYDIIIPGGSPFLRAVLGYLTLPTSEAKWRYVELTRTTEPFKPEELTPASEDCT